MPKKIDFVCSSGKKEDLLVIDSWTGGPTASPATNEENDKFYLRANSVEEKEQSGWGAPPPSNPNGWGQPPPKIGNWQQPPPPQGEIKLYFFHIAKR